MKSDKNRGGIKERELLRSPKKALVQIILMQLRIIEEYSNLLSHAIRRGPD